VKLDLSRKDFEFQTTLGKENTNGHGLGFQQIRSLPHSLGVS